MSMGEFFEVDWVESKAFPAEATFFFPFIHFDNR